MFLCVFVCLLKSFLSWPFPQRMLSLPWAHLGIMFLKAVLYHGSLNLLSTTRLEKVCLASFWYEDIL